MSCDNAFERWIAIHIQIQEFCHPICNAQKTMQIRQEISKSETWQKKNKTKKSYLVLMFPLRVWLRDLSPSLYPLLLLFNWLALVLGKRKEGFPVPGRTGPFRPSTLSTTTFNRNTPLITTNRKIFLPLLAPKADILTSLFFSLFTFHQIHFCKYFTTSNSNQTGAKNTRIFQQSKS